MTEIMLLPDFCDIVLLDCHLRVVFFAVIPS